MPPSDTTPETPREIDLVRELLSQLNARLPPGWTARLAAATQLGQRDVDAVVELTASDREGALLVVEAKRGAVQVRDLQGILEQLETAVRRAGSRAVPMLVARYLAPSVRQRLTDTGVAYADATGNLRIVLERPALFVDASGSDRDPWRGPGRPRGSLKGSPAARVVRALVDYRPPVTVPELVRRSRASTGATYRVVEFLDQEGLIERKARGAIVAIEWRPILRRWSDDYGFLRSNQVHGFLHPRGIHALLEALRSEQQLGYAVTGSLAAQQYAPYAPPRLANLYVSDVTYAVRRLDLRSVDRGVNVLLAAASSEVVFERVVEVDRVRFAAPSQTAVDLLTGPGRNPAEAEALLDWMDEHESEWRR